MFVKQLPLPMRRLIGTLPNTRQVLHAFGLTVTKGNSATAHRMTRTVDEREARLGEAEEPLRAIRSGEVDAFRSIQSPAPSTPIASWSRR
jgi:hypothetical protein